MKRRTAFFISIFALAQVFGRSLSSSEFSSREPASLEARPSSSAFKKEIHVLPMNSRFPASELKRDGYNVSELRERLLEDMKAEPEPRERDLLFQKAGAGKFAARLDQLDRSFLFLRAQDYSDAKFARAYPQLSPETRARLQAAAKAWGR